MTDTTTELVPAGETDVVASEPASSPVPVEAHHAEHAHATPRQYVLIAVILSIVTGMEVAASYLPDDVPSNMIILLLAVMAIVKFTLVVLWFMHLKFDSPILRRFFLVGLLGAPPIYMIVLLSLHAFQSGV